MKKKKHHCKTNIFLSLLGTNKKYFKNIHSTNYRIQQLLLYEKNKLSGVKESILNLLVQSSSKP